LTEKELSIYIGDYILPNGEVRKILVIDNKIYYQVNENTKAEMFPESKKIFHVGKSSQIKFYSNENEEITHFELNTGKGIPVLAQKSKK
jgi:hypothetical protein